MSTKGPITFSNPLDGLRYGSVRDVDRHQDLLFLYPVPLPGNPWGVLEPLRETSWGMQIPAVSGEALSHALHGHVTPLRKMLGNPPRIRASKITMEDRLCLEAQRALCPMATKHCCPGSGQIPECYVPPTENRALTALGHAVGTAWDEGRYVFIVEGPEFVIT